MLQEINVDLGQKSYDSNLPFFHKSLAQKCYDPEKCYTKHPHHNYGENESRLLQVRASVTVN